MDVFWATTEEPMMGNDVFGMSHSDFERAVQRELDGMSVHTHRDGLRPGQGKPTKQTRKRRQPDVKTPDIADRHVQAMLRTRPGSPEREAAVRAINPEIYDEAQREEKVRTLSMLLDTWEASEVGDRYDQQVIAEVARLVWDTQVPEVFWAARQRIESIVGDTDHYDRLFATRVENEARKQQAQYDQSESDRVGQVQASLEDEYAKIEQKLGQNALAAADEIAQAFGDELYDPQVDPEAARVGLRAAAEVARAQERTGNVFSTLQEIGEEMRRYGPAGADHDREAWEARMQEADYEAAEREHAKTDPDAAAARALQARAYERAGTTPFEAALSEELDALSAEPPHRQALRDQNVAAWERAHDDAGRETVNLTEEQRR